MVLKFHYFWLWERVKSSKFVLGKLFTEYSRIFISSQYDIPIIFWNFELFCKILVLWAVLPPNIIPFLRKVTTSGCYLTFERFCAGLKIAILRHSAQRHRQADTDSSEGSMVRIHVLFLLHKVFELRKFWFGGKVVMSKFVLVKLYMYSGLCGFFHLRYSLLKPNS